MQFREDINGLRAIAVIAVILFHFNSSWIPGGFAGVDVFFVISGFLMTGIIFKGLEQQKFSILRFYVARANRIIPALAILCVILLILGWFYLTPQDYKALGKHAASSIAFVSNVTYWLESGYFDALSSEKWLLHTWSLSVEWQFYLIYPLVLVALYKFISIDMMKKVVLVSTILGFVFCVIATYKWSKGAYFLLPSRAWEMMLGGVAYLYPFSIKDKQKKLVEWIGIALILGSYFLISKDTPWPGYFAVFPVLGAFLVIQAQRNNSIVTSNIVFQKLGAWSYSIYLWHWPLVVIIYYFSLNNNYIYIGIALSVLLGFLSNKYIEKIKFKSNFNKRLDYLKCKPLYLALIVGIAGYIVISNNGFDSEVRLTSEQLIVTNGMHKNKREHYCGTLIDGDSPSCKYGDGEVKAIVLGDSHAQALVEGIGVQALLYNGSVIDWGLKACNTIKGVYTTDNFGNVIDDSCGKLVSKLITRAGKEFKGVPVIIINRTSQNLIGKNEDKTSSPPNRFVDKRFQTRSDAYRENLVSHMVDTICEFTENNPVYLLRPLPELKINVPKSMFRSMLIQNQAERVKLPKLEYDTRQKTAYEMQNKAVQKCGAKILNPIPLLCDSEFCHGDIDGKPLYFDDDHLNLYGTKIISPVFDEVFMNN
ncbi:acyltransferase family protein [Pseudoalteromonas sp. NZS71_1]|uniref:acyltransferase family protein n=1 Tax=Pseudoalteromonas sp. NZS71_1 TaxID=2792072 RepID=UPI001E313E00|nr:acyltransferase family protein [Pseudoalteromonas sp. NZS71_1]